MSATTVLSLAFLAAVVGAVPQFEVSLDEPPETRWNNVMKYWIDTGIAQGISDLFFTDPPMMPVAIQEEWWTVVEPTLDDIAKKEAAGMASSLDAAGIHTGNKKITAKDILLFAHMYEMNYPVFCSAIVAAMPNGTVLHARNLDYGITLMVKGKEVGWPQLTTDVTLTRGGKPLITMVYWPLQLGVHTAMRFDGYTFEQNSRHRDPEEIEMEVNMEAFKKGGLGYSIVMRRLMERVPDFESAVQEAYSTNFAANSYFTMTGVKPYEGAVLSIDRGGVHKAGTPPIKRLASSGVNMWQIVQTNDDQGEPAADERRPVEAGVLALTSQKEVSAQWAFEEMHQWPLFNDGTAFTWIAIPSTGYHATVLPTETLPGLSPLKEMSFLAKRKIREQLVLTASQ